MAIDDALRRQGIDILEAEQVELDGAFEKQSTESAPSSLLFDKIEQNDDGTWSKTQYTPRETFYDENIIPQKETEIKNKAEVLQSLCREVDNKVIRFNNLINEKKQEIVNLSTEATNGNCWPGIAYSSLVPGNPQPGPGGTGIQSSFGVVNSDINNDVEFVKIYDKMAGPGYDPGAENPFDPDRLVILNSSYSGYGYKNVRDNKEIRNTSNVVTGVNTDGSGSDIGNGRFDISSTEADHNARQILAEWYYGGAGGSVATDNTVTAARCVAIASSIDSIYQEILEIRRDRDSLRGALNKVKKNKSEKELTHWGMQNTKTESTRRRSSNNTAINALRILDVEEDATELPEGLVLDLDASNNSSYFGSGNTWYDLAESADGTTVPDVDATLVGVSTFIESTVTNLQNHFQLDGVSGTVDFAAPNILTGITSTTTVTVEILAQVHIDTQVQADQGYMIFGWEKYDVWTGPVIGDGTQIALGFNTAGSDLYGLSPLRVEQLGINKDDGPTDADHDTLPGQWTHYIFEMRSDVSYTNNKIYINGDLQTALEVVRAGTGERPHNRHFNVNGNNEAEGRISGWRFDNNYKIPMEISLFRVYNKALTQEEVTERYDAVGERFVN
jgi:hypothetical protein